MLVLQAIYITSYYDSDYNKTTEPYCEGYRLPHPSRPLAITNGWA